MSCSLFMHWYQRKGKAPSLLATVDRNRPPKASSKKKKFLSGKKSAVIPASLASSGDASLAAMPDFAAIAALKQSYRIGLETLGKID